MADEIVTREQLVNASLDADSLDYLLVVRILRMF